MKMKLFGLIRMIELEGYKLESSYLAIYKMLKFTNRSTLKPSSLIHLASNKENKFQCEII